MTKRKISKKFKLKRRKNNAKSLRHSFEYFVQNDFKMAMHQIKM